MTIAMIGNNAAITIWIPLNTGAVSTTMWTGVAVGTAVGVGVGVSVGVAVGTAVGVGVGVSVGVAVGTAVGVGVGVSVGSVVALPEIETSSTKHQPPLPQQRLYMPLDGMEIVQLF
jgi:hypothetical protein